MTSERQLLDRVPRQLWIGGRWRDATGGASLEVHDPATGKRLTSVADATPADAVAALDAAVGAQHEWAGHPPRERGRSCAGPTRRCTSRWTTWRC